MINKSAETSSQREEGYNFHVEARELDLQLAAMEQGVRVYWFIIDIAGQNPLVMQKFS